jgi:hydroxymethylglutaryl-CoA reductase
MLETLRQRINVQVVAAAGLAQNFCCLCAPDYNRHTGWHMKMHLNNILNQFDVRMMNAFNRKHFKHHATQRSCRIIVISRK